jgi:hypothetical protein
MNQDYWEADSRFPDNRGHITNPLPGERLWPEEDQMHHFAGYFVLGTHGLPAETNLVLRQALKSTGDYGKDKNPGDYDLGVVGYDLGKLYDGQPGYMSSLIRKRLTEPAVNAFFDANRGALP